MDLLSFKDLFLLIENRINFLKDQNKGGIDTSHDTLAKHTDPSAVIDHFANNADPTPKKNYTQWIVNRYKDKNFRQEDHPRIKQALMGFDKHKAKLAKKDINQYKSLGEVEDAVKPHDNEYASKKEEKKAIKAEGADLVHSSGGVTVHKLKTKEAACAYGAGTKWCTAAKNNNMFDEYNEQGPLHVIQHQGRKYQFHGESGQFMDEHDNPVKLTDVHPDIAKELHKSSDPSIQHFNFQQHNPHVTEKDISDVFEKHPHGWIDEKRAAISHPNATPKNIDKALDDPDSHVRSVAAQNPNANEHNITKAISLINPEGNHHRDDLIHYVWGHKNFNSKHIDQIMDIDPVKTGYDENQQTRIIKSHPKVTSQNIDRAIEHPNPFVRLGAIQHPTLITAKHINKVMGNTKENNALVRVKALEHPKATVEHVDKGMKDPESLVRNAAIKNPHSTEEHISQALNDPDHYVRDTALNHPKVNAKHLTQVFKNYANDNSENAIKLKTKALKHPKINSDHITQAMNDSSDYIRGKAIYHTEANEDHISKALKDSATHVRETALAHPKVNDEHIATALKDENTNVRDKAFHLKKFRENFTRS